MSHSKPRLIRVGGSMTNSPGRVLFSAAAREFKASRLERSKRPKQVIFFMAFHHIPVRLVVKTWRPQIRCRPELRSPVSLGSWAPTPEIRRLRHGNQRLRRRDRDFTGAVRGLGC